MYGCHCVTCIVVSYFCNAIWWTSVCLYLDKIIGQYFTDKRDSLALRPNVIHCYVVLRTKCVGIYIPIGVSGYLTRVEYAKICDYYAPSQVRHRIIAYFTQSCYTIISQHCVRMWNIKHAISEDRSVKLRTDGWTLTD